MNIDTPQNEKAGHPCQSKPAKQSTCKECTSCPCPAQYRDELAERISVTLYELGQKPKRVSLQEILRDLCGEFEWGCFCLIRALKSGDGTAREIIKTLPVISTAGFHAAGLAGICIRGRYRGDTRLIRRKMDTDPHVLVSWLTPDARGIFAIFRVCPHGAPRETVGLLTRYLQNKFGVADGFRVNKAQPRRVCLSYDLYLSCSQGELDGFVVPFCAGGAR